MRHVRRLAAVGTVLGAALAAAAGGKDDPSLPFELAKFSLLLSRILADESAPLAAAPRAEASDATRDLRSGAADSSTAAGRVADAAARTRDTLSNRLKETALELHDRIGETAATDPAGAALAAGAGLGTPADKLHAVQLRVDARVDASIASSFARAGRAFDKTGEPVSLVIPGTNTPLHPTAAASPAAFPRSSLLALTGTCDGRIVVRMSDPAAGDASGASFVALEGETAAEQRELTSAADFASPGPQVFEFTGLAPGNYLVYAGVVADGVHFPRESAVVTVPECPPAGASATRAGLHNEAAVLGHLFARDTARDSAAFRAELRQLEKPLRRGTLSPEQATTLLVDLLFGFWEGAYARDQAIANAWHAELRAAAAADPAAAARESGAGGRTASDALDTSLERTAARRQASVGQLVLRTSRAIARQGLPVTHVGSGLGRALHPGAPEGLAFTGNPFTDPIVALLAAGDGRLWVLARDPAAAQASGESSVELFDALDFDPVADRRLASSTDFADSAVAVVPFSGLRPGVYVVVTSIVVGGLKVPVGVGAISVPVPSGSPPAPLPCDGTTASVTIDGVALAIPPLKDFIVTATDSQLRIVTLIFKDVNDANAPQVGFQLSVATPIDVSGPAGVELVSTLPTTDHVASTYVFDPVTKTSTAVTTGTITMRNLGNLVRPSACCEVVASGTAKDGRPVAFRFTMHTDDTTR